MKLPRIFPSLLSFLVAGSLIVTGTSIVPLARAENDDLDSFDAPTVTAPSEAPVSTPEPAAISDEDVTTGHVLMPDLNPAVERALLDSVFNDAPFRVEELSALQIPTTEQLAVWTGSTSSMTSELKDITISFKYPLSGKAIGEEHPPFELKISFEKPYARQWFTFQHSLAKKPRQQNGIRLESDGKDSQRTYYAGIHGTGLLIIIPKYLSSENAHAFLLCPREFPSAQLGDPKVSLRGTEYEAYDTRYTFAGRGQSFLKTGRDVGMIRARILTSPNVARSEPWIDELFQKNPQLEVSYVPVLDEELARNRDRNNIKGGLEIAFETQLPAGKKRIAYHQNVVWLKKVPVATALNISSVTLRNPAKKFSEVKVPVDMGSGDCYLFLNQQTVRYEYSDEPIKLPPRLAATPRASSTVSSGTPVGDDAEQRLPFDE